MIRKLTDKDNDKIMVLLMENPIVNYFIIMSLEREHYKAVFKEKWGQFNHEDKLISLLFQRKSGTLQFYSSQDYDPYEICSIIRKLDFDRLIGENSIINRLINTYSFSKIEKGAIISKLDSLMVDNDRSPSNVKPVTIKDIDRIIELYHQVFTGFAPKELIIEKYQNNTGRGYYIEDEERIISVVQSSYESYSSAIIVGVATHPDYRKKGFATECLIKICNELVSEGKVLYLQYDNPKAGKIYKELGFKDIGRMINCYNITVTQ